MNSKRSHEGEFLLDHRNSPGIPDAVGIPWGLPPGAGRGLFEGPSYTCSHCQFIVVLNPKRNRERAWCRGCDHYLCDSCGAERALTGKCKTYKQTIDEILTAESRRHT